MAKYRFVHVSDIHFGQEKQNGTVVARDDVRAELLNDCRTRENKLGPADSILVTGDVAFSGKKDEYTRAGKWLDELTKAVGCRGTSVFVVPGNHDVDLDEIGDGVHRSIAVEQHRRPRFAGNDQGSADG